MYAEQAADAGNLRPAADICDWLLGDDRISGLLNTRAQSLLGLDPTFEKAGDKRRSGIAVRALEGQDDYSAAYPECELVRMIVWGILLGIAPMKHRWVRSDEHGGRLLPMPEFWHPQHLRQDISTRQWKTRVSQIGMGGAMVDEVDVNAGDGTWILHTPYGGNRPAAMGVWRGLARWALIKHLAMWDKSRLGEKGGLLVAETQPGMLLPTSKEESNKAQRDQLADDLYGRGREGVAVLPPGYNLKLVESLSDSRSLYDALIDKANEAFAIRIRGGNLTTQVSGGSLAAAEVQERVGENAIRRFDAQALTTTLHDQSLVWWAQFNFGDRRLTPWPVYTIEDDDDLLKSAQAVSWILDAIQGAPALGFEIDRKAFADYYDVGSYLLPALGEPNPGSPEARKAAAKAAKKAARDAAQPVDPAADPNAPPPANVPKSPKPTNPTKPKP